MHDQDEKSRDTISISSSTIIGGCGRIDAVPPVREQVIGEQTGSAIMSDAFTPCKATILPGARSVPTLLPTQRLAQPGGSGLEKEGRWFRLEALNMSDLILSRRTLPPSLPHALYFAIRTNISSPAAPRDLGAERLINACYDERARHHHDSPTATALDEAGWP